MISSIILYFFQTVICLSFFFLLYCLFLKRETFFKSNRLFLIFTLLFSLLIPILDYTFNTGVGGDSPMLGNVVSASQELLNTNMLRDVVVVASKENVIFIQFFILIYIIGVVGLFCRFTYNLSRLLYWINFNYRNNSIVVLNNDYPPFSFLNYIFINQNDLSSKDINSIIEHEKAHIKQAHSIDLIIVEIICVFFWINPLVWIYKSFIQEIHEFLADKAVLLSKIDSGEYKKHIVNRFVGDDIFDMANNFGHSNLKRRIMMLGCSKSSRLALFKFLLLIPISFFLLSAFTLSIKKQESLYLIDNQEILNFSEFKEITSNLYYDKYYANNTIDFVSMSKGIDNLEYKKTLNLEETFQISDYSPKYPGGLDALNKYIESNMIYPILASNNDITGEVYVNFRVNSLGQIDNAKINKSESHLLDQEALNLVLNMKQWKPAAIKGANVAYTIPVVFDKHKSKPVNYTPALVVELDNSKTENLQIAKYSSMKIYDKVDFQPKFYGGNRKLFQFINKNVTYPKLAIEQSYEGRVVVSFIIDKYGDISSPEIIKGVNIEIDNEALRLVGIMPKWKPATLNEKNVAVRYVLPIMFKLK